MTSNSFGTILITKDRNWCLERTVKALFESDIARHSIVVLNNGSTQEDPLQALSDLECEYITVSQNIGVVGARVLAHRIAEQKGWSRYCFLQDDFELKTKKPWLQDTLTFMEEFQIDYCRLTCRESALGENEHWVKGVLRVQSGARAWNCSHIQSKRFERVGGTEFSISDKHYSDWVHIVTTKASRKLFNISSKQLHGPSVTDILLSGQPFEAFNGAVRSEMDFAVRHWIAYALGMISATGIVEDHACWCGLFDHFTGKSTTDYRDLPGDLSILLRELE